MKSINTTSLVIPNIKSINAKFSEVGIFIEEIKSINFKFSNICLQECWIADNYGLSQIQLN